MVPVSVLALVPPDKAGNALSRYTFLSEELEALAARGSVRVHTASPYVATDRTLGRVTVHAMPSLRHAISLRVLSVLLDRANGEHLAAVHRVDRWRLALEQVALSRVIRAARASVIYSPFAWPRTTAGSVAARLTDTPVVISLRGVDALVEPSIGYGQTLDPCRRRRLSGALRSAHHVIGVSRHLADRAIELGAAVDRVSVICKGVDLDRFSPGPKSASRERLGLSDAPTILFVGGLIPRKGVIELVRAFRHVREQVGNARLILCGKGPLRAELARLAQELGVGEAVRFTGWVERDTIPDYFRACDVFVLPSLAEGSGNVLLEAGATGRPVVAADVCGIPDYIVNEETGLLTPKRDVPALAKALLRLITDESLQTELGRRGRARVESRFPYSRMIDDLESLFERAAARRAR